MKRISLALGVVLVLGTVAAWAQDAARPPAAPQNPAEIPGEEQDKPSPMRIFGCGGGDFQAPVEEEKPDAMWIFGGSILVAVSPGNDAVWAYSRQTGMWRKQAIKNQPEEPIQPIVAADMATFQVGETLYAYSGPKGRWTSLSLSGKEKPKITHHAGMILVQVGQNLSAFSAETGTWDTINLESD